MVVDHVRLAYGATRFQRRPPQLQVRFRLFLAILLGEALGATREGQEKLSQAAGRQAQYMDTPFTRQTGAEQRLNQTFGQFDPTATSSFMNPYEDQVVQQARTLIVQ